MHNYDNMVELYGIKTDNLYQQYKLIAGNELHQKTPVTDTEVLKLLVNFGNVANSVVEANNSNNELTVIPDLVSVSDNWDNLTSVVNLQDNIRLILIDIYNIFTQIDGEITALWEAIAALGDGGN